MRDLWAEQVSVFEKFVVAGQLVKAYSCFVACYPGGSAPVPGGILDDMVGWFARLLCAHETSLLCRRRESPPARETHGAMDRPKALGMNGRI